MKKLENYLINANLKNFWVYYRISLIKSALRDCPAQIKCFGIEFVNFDRDILANFATCLLAKSEDDESQGSLYSLHHPTRGCEVLSPVRVY